VRSEALCLNQQAGAECEVFLGGNWGGVGSVESISELVRADPFRGSGVAGIRKGIVGIYKDKLPKGEERYEL